MKSHQEKLDVIIVGGGIFGCAIAYYYSRNNPGKKILIVERNELCNAATSRAAALITRIRSKEHFIPLSLETYHVIPELENLLGESLDMKNVGVMHVAASDESVEGLRDLVSIAKKFNQPHEYISNEEAHRSAPWLNTRDALAIAFMEGEAYCDPYLLGTFFARAARKLGAKFKPDCEVTGLIKENETAVGVRTKEEIIYADKIIIAAGAWSPLLAADLDIAIPMAPVRSQYWITEKSDLFPVNSPIVLLPDAQAYARPEGGSLLFGIREKKSFTVSPKNIPAEISNFSFSPDKGQSDLMEVIDRLANFFPSIYETGLKYYIAGFSGYTPDNNLSMGKVKKVANLYLATGCVGAGISVCGGVGLAFAEMVADKPNPFDFSMFDIDRFGKIDPFSNDWLQKCALARSRKTSG